MNAISTDRIVQPVPEPTVRRMPSYLNLLREMLRREEQFVSAPAIAKLLHLDPTQVVKDLSYTGISGKPRVGYMVSELVLALEDFLGYNRTHEAFLVGAGYLGSALIQYQGFRESGLKIVAAFDIDKRKVGSEIAGVPVFHLEKFRDLASRLHISIGILTTPAPAAQSVADLMVGWGIKAIWNFAPVPLIVPEHVIVQDTHIYANLAVILNKLKQAKAV
ncbi:MAG: redox-sensing transcriptional repressor Rex [Bacteroidia bacterium]|nr:redox-sensing transcriptional repressor Rex [Bacteroidia bacterium]